MSDGVDQKALVLPPSIVSRLDVARLLAEVEQIDNTLTTAEVRQKAGAEAEPATAQSSQLGDFLQVNHLEQPVRSDWARLVKELRQLKDHAPVVHLTFATVADPESLRQLAAWARETLHPQTVLAVGLQPGLIGGVYVRTPNQVHDLSMRGLLKGSRGVLTKELEALRGAK